MATNKVTKVKRVAPKKIVVKKKTYKAKKK